MGVGKVTEGWDWMRREARIRVCVVLMLCLRLSGGVEEVGCGVPKSDRAASYTARFRSGQVAGVGATPEGHG
jgi:hypothetical protein